MMDRKQENKELDSMTDKVTEEEVKGSATAMQSLSTANTSNQNVDSAIRLVPNEKDLELLQKHLVSNATLQNRINVTMCGQGVSRFEIIDEYTKAEGDFGTTVSGLLRTF